MNFERSITCSFSGHRILPKDFDTDELEKAVYNAINDGFLYFLVGMAIGFDTVCFETLLKFKREKDVFITACVPCRDQAEFFNKKQKKRYEGLLKQADEVIFLSEKYYEGCMQARNEFMVDNSSRLICYLKTNYGGTYSTVRYAVEKNLDIVYLDR